MSQFFEDVRAFNDMYDLPNPDKPTQDIEYMKERLAQFKRIILKEVAEVDDIIANLKNGDVTAALTDISDWLGDITVYACSEMRRFGLPSEVILKIIMQSNFSKKGLNGEVLKDADNKVMKGPNYWKPEPSIAKMLIEHYGLPTAAAV